VFGSIGWGEIGILVIAGLVILGPERLPGAVQWTMKSLRQVRDYATGATDQLKNDLGTDFDDLREPLAQLNELRGMTPRAMITKHLLDGDDSMLRDVSSSMQSVRSEFDSVTRAANGRSDEVPNKMPPRADDAPPTNPAPPIIPAPRPSSPAAAPDVADWDAT
jgi:sec-independent protein translocase protein TatB